MKNLISFLVVSLCFTCLSACGTVPAHDESGQQYDKSEKKKAPEVIFIHGMFVTSKCWEGWVQSFQKAGYKVSAPAWPLHDGRVEDLRQPSRFEELAKLELSDVLESYRKIIKTKSAKPILIGHSMGGLVAQILLAEGLAEAAIVLDSAPPHGVFGISWSSLKSNWGIINPFASSWQPVEKDFDGFSYAFTSEQTREVQESAYRDYYVPESRRVGNAPLGAAGDVKMKEARGPLLLFAGGKDHIIPAKLSYDNFKFYKKTPGYTEFILFPERDHWTLHGKGWEQVADTALSWIKKRYSLK